MCPMWSVGAVVQLGLRQQGFSSRPYQRSTCARENFSRPSGTACSFPLYPALKRGAIVVTPLRGWLLPAGLHGNILERILTHTVNRLLKTR